MALRRKLIKRAEEVKEANFKAVLSNKPLVFSLTLTSGYFLGLNDESNVVSTFIYLYIYLSIILSLLTLSLVCNLAETFNLNQIEGYCTNKRQSESISIIRLVIVKKKSIDHKKHVYLKK